MVQEIPFNELKIIGFNGLGRRWLDQRKMKKKYKEMFVPGNLREQFIHYFYYS